MCVATCQDDARGCWDTRDDVVMVDSRGVQAALRLERLWLYVREHGPNVPRGAAHHRLYLGNRCRLRCRLHRRLRICMRVLGQCDATHAACAQGPVVGVDVWPAIVCRALNAWYVDLREPVVSERAKVVVDLVSKQVRE